MTTMTEVIDVALSANKEKIVQDAFVSILELVVNFDDFKEKIKQVQQEVNHGFRR